MPYYKYFMEYLSFNSFFGLGVLCLLNGMNNNNFKEIVNKFSDCNTNSIDDPFFEKERESEIYELKSISSL